MAYLAHVLQVNNASGESTSLTRTFILYYHILIAHSHGVTLRCFLKGRTHKFREVHSRRPYGHAIGGRGMMDESGSQLIP